MSNAKESISQAVDRLADELESLSRQIHAHPELGYQEVQACGWLSDFLARQGFKVEKGVGGVDTAFRGTIETGDGPTVAILCEYDALPGIGHACGHNVIATSGAGAGAALAAVRAQLPKGRIQVIGTPAEEGGGGKIKLIKGGRLPGRGLRDDDPRVRPHHPAPGPARHRARHLRVHRQGLARLRRSVGRASTRSTRSSRPTTRSACCASRCARTAGSTASSPTAARRPTSSPSPPPRIFYMRAPRIDTMWELFKRVTAAAEGAAKATGCTFKVTQHESVYEPMKSSRVMLDLFAANMTAARASPRARPSRTASAPPTSAT